MKNSQWLVFLFCFTLLGTALGEEARGTKPYLLAQRKLAINRSLLTSAESEYKALTQEDDQQSSDEHKRKIANLGYKIQALKEDARRLQSELPKNLRAHEFLKDLETGGQVDVARDKNLSDKLDSVFAMHEKALGLVAEKRYDLAAKVYEDIVLLSPDDDEAYLLLGHCRLLNTDYEKARDAFLNAIHIDPSNAKEVTRLYENILVENPRDDAAYAHLGFAEWMLGKKEEAKRAFESALELNPANNEARVALTGMASEV